MPVTSDPKPALGSVTKLYDCKEQIYHIEWISKDSMVVAYDDKLDFIARTEGVTAMTSKAVVAMPSSEAGSAFGGERNPENKAFVFSAVHLISQKVFAVGTSDGKLHLVSLDTSKEGDAAWSVDGSVQAHSGPTTSMAAATGADGDYLVTGGTEGIRVWTVTVTGDGVSIVKRAHAITIGTVYDIQEVAEGRLATITSVGLVQLWKLRELVAAEMDAGAALEAAQGDKEEAPQEAVMSVMQECFQKYNAGGGDLGTQCFGLGVDKQNRRIVVVGAPASAHGHGHSHGGEPCHGHGDDGSAHGHSHGGEPCHGHGDDGGDGVSLFIFEW
jgi:hypothetical protein